jgi:DNA-directed RNA polymerase-3 subunit RPC5
MDDDDPILKTIPIQFSSSNVSLLQFPTISKPFSANELPVAARMKMGRMLLDFKLPQHSSAERAAQLKLSTMQYESKIVAMQNNYFAAILDNDQLHLTSVDSILQFRPNLSFIDQNAASQNPKDPADTQDEGKVVQVVARASDPELERKSAVANMRKLMDEEPWLDYQIVSMDSSLAQQKLKDLSASCDMEIDQQTHSADDYLDLIHPRLINNQSQDSDKPTELSLAQIMTLSPQYQIKNILINAQVIDLETLERLTNLDRASIVTFALDYSMIVGGRFIVSSELIYDDHQPLLKHARTYAIYLFLIKQFVSVKEIVSMSTLLPEMAKSMLQDIARPSSNGWKLKIEAISSFEEDYGDISKQQLALVEKAGIW